MEELLIIGLIWLFGGGDDESAGAKKEDDWSYDTNQWEKVASGFARKLAWRVYRDTTADVETFELAFKNPEGLNSEGPFDSQEAAEARAKELGAAPE